MRLWIAEVHRLIAKYDGKVSVKKETVKVEIIKEGSGWVLQLDSELEPMELRSKWLSLIFAAVALSGICVPLSRLPTWRGRSPRERST